MLQSSGSESDFGFEVVAEATALQFSDELRITRTSHEPDDHPLGLFPVPSHPAPPCRVLDSVTGRVAATPNRCVGTLMRVPGEVRSERWSCHIMTQR